MELLTLKTYSVPTLKSDDPPPPIARSSELPHICIVAALTLSFLYRRIACLDKLDFTLVYSRGRIYAISHASALVSGKAEFPLKVQRLLSREPFATDSLCFLRVASKSVYIITEFTTYCQELFSSLLTQVLPSFVGQLLSFCQTKEVQYPERPEFEQCTLLS